MRKLTVHARVDTYIGATVDQIAFMVKLHSPLHRAITKEKESGRESKEGAERELGISKISLVEIQE